MAYDRLLTRPGRPARRFMAAALVIALIAAVFVADAQAARVLPLPRVTAETYETVFHGRPAVVLQTLLLRRIHGTPEVTCNGCRRFARYKSTKSRPSRTSRRYRHADWILRGGRAVKVKVTRKGWIGRYLLLTARRRNGRLGLGYKSSGCLRGRGAKIRCPHGTTKTPPIITVVPVPVPVPPDAPPAGGTPAVPAAPTKGVIYGVGQAGQLMWWRHKGREDIASGWEGPKKVGSGWGNFKDVFSGDDGVIYGVQPNGDLMWYRHGGYATGTPGVTGPKKVGTGWAGFKDVFSGGGGVIYGVLPNGDLMWYRHGGYATGTAGMAGPKKVGTGWNGFTRVFSGGDGVIYGVLPNGDLQWYRHGGYATGTPGIVGPLKVGHGWAGFKQISPALA